MLFSKAWLKTTTPENISSGFKHAGIIPFNPNTLSVPDAPVSTCASSNSTDENVSPIVLSSVNESSVTSQYRMSLPPTTQSERYPAESLVDSFINVQPLDPVAMLYSTNSLLSPSIVNNTTQSALPPVSLTTNRQVEEQPTESLQTDLLTSSSPVVNTISSSLTSVSLIQTNALPTPTPSTSSASQLCPSTSKAIPTSALNKHLKPLTLLQSKPTKTGSARVLTSA